MPTNWFLQQTGSNSENGRSLVTDQMDSKTNSSAILTLNAKVFLQGSYDQTTGLMRDDLRNTYLPNSEPYGALGFTLVNSGGETFDNGLLSTTGNDALVDWVLVELRDKIDPSVIVATQSALLQRDGDIVSTDGISAVSFQGITQAAYFISIAHRNHLRVTSAILINLSSTPTTLDFTIGATPTAGNDAQITMGNNIFALYSGDSSSDNMVDAGDRSYCWNNRNQTGYLSVDVNLDGLCDASDRSIVWNNRNHGVEMPKYVSDNFEGNGPLLNYTTNNPSAVPGVTRTNGRYRAEVLDNSGNVTVHFHGDQGRLDAKEVVFPFEYIVRNIGIGTLADSQIAPPDISSYVFAGIQAHVYPDFNSINSSHFVVGHRGSKENTVEGKNTVNGYSTVNDAGTNVVPDGRADLRVVGLSNNTILWYYQVPNFDIGVTPDNWIAYRGTGLMPGTPPVFGDTIYIGPITYAYGSNNVPFVGTIDSIELVGETP